MSVQRKIKFWQEKLLDLSMRNRLLNFRPTKVTTIRLIDELPPEIFKLLAVDRIKMRFLPLKEETENDEEVITSSNFSKGFTPSTPTDLQERYVDKYLQTNLSRASLDKNLFRIFSKASSAMEERGYNVLFLALGFIEWYEAPQSDIKRKSPLFLLPVELERTSVRIPFKLSYNGEQLIFNPALALKFKRDFGIDLDFEIPEDSELIDLRVYFERIYEIIFRIDRWKVTNDIYLGLFSFEKYIMYKDIERYADKLKTHPIIMKLCGQNYKLSSPDLLPEDNPREIENYFSPSTTFQVLDADLSQQRAILSAKKGINFVIEGPPGTGKSQTIANIISEFLAEGKKVLFVSQKMAALEVVKKRLEEVGLGDFCLELHSRKTDKTKVLKELGRVLELRQISDHRNDEELLELERIRNRLNEYIDNLLSPAGNLGIAPYDAIGKFLLSSDVKDIEFIFEDAAEWDKDRFKYVSETLESLVQILEKIQDYKTHPWKGVTIIDLDYGLEVKVKKLIDEILKIIQLLYQRIQKLIRYAYFARKPLNIHEIRSIIEDSKYLLDIEELSFIPSFEILFGDLWESKQEEIQKMKEIFKELDTNRNWIEERYNLSIIEVNRAKIKKLLMKYTAYTKDVLFFLKPTFWLNRSFLRKFLDIKKYNPSLKDILNDLIKIDRTIELFELIESYSALGQTLFGPLWRKNSSFYKIENYIECVNCFRKFIKEKYWEDSVYEKIHRKTFDFERLKIILNEISETFETFYNKVKDFVNITQLVDTVTFEGKTLKEVSLDMVYVTLKNMKENFDEIYYWIKFQKLLNEFKKIGIENFVYTCLSEAVPCRDIPRLFTKNFLKSWLSEIMKRDPLLKDYYSEKLESLWEKFKLLDEKQIVLARIRLRNKLSEKVSPLGERIENSEVNILRREILKKRRQKPVRKLFELVPNVILHLKPCLMMSPFTVAQFIKPDIIEFDLIIFDEASQIPPEDAIGSIMRGKQVIIAGDTQQLPPTTFFQAEVMTSEDYSEEFEDYWTEELDSILEEVKASGLPSLMLRWHYRSRDESLITFSNKNFYYNKLITFPNAFKNSQELGIKFHYVPNGIYDRGGTKTNRIEAEKVAVEVMEHFRKYPNLSLGVGTFSIQQKYAVEDAIEYLLRQDNSLEYFFKEDRSEHFFIKNLETIQGDERDVIFISVGYGRDKNGRLTLNFGPINKAGGYRRLNVLITRARYRVEIFSSIKADDIDISQTDNYGVKLLKKYLEFAEKGEEVFEYEYSPGEFSESPFEEAVYLALCKLGIPVKRQVGCSGYRIDLAVLDPAHPGKYILGIECDGASYHSHLTARDRDRLRQQVLENLGWNIYRIWSVDWFRNPKRELEKLLQAIDLAKRGIYSKKRHVCEDFIQYAHNIPESEEWKDIETYSLTPITEVASPYDFYLGDICKVAEKLKIVIEHEGPIYREEAWRRVIKFWGLAAVKERIREILQMAEDYGAKNSLFKIKGEFYWPLNMEIPKVRRRNERSLLDIKLIAPEEIGETALIVLKYGLSLYRPDLVTQTARLLGFSRTSESIYNYVNESIMEYEKIGKIIEINGRLQLPQK